MNRHLLLAQALTVPWAMHPDMLRVAYSVLWRWSSQQQASDDVFAKIDEDKEIMAARRERSAKNDGALAVVPLYGLLLARPPENISGPGGTSTNQFAQLITRLASDDSIQTILIDIDSPGGSVFGMVEATNAVWQARQKKPVIALANTMAASAAYMIASQATELYVTASGQVGSIGVYTVHQSFEKSLENDGVATTLISAGNYKTEGNPYQALSDEAKTAIKAQVDIYYRQFVNAVSRGRGVNASQVTGGMGQGRMLTAELAVEEKLADGIATLDELIARYQPSSTQSNGNANRRRRLAL